MFLGGFSMGAGVIGSLWPDRPAAAGVFLLHATTTVPEGIPIGTPVQGPVTAPRTTSRDIRRQKASSYQPAQGLAAKGRSAPD
jgi:hypothetical protein